MDALSLPFVQRGVLELLLLSVPAGLLGTWIVLRGTAFLAHATGTAAVPGLVVAQGLGFAPVLGALGSATVLAGGVAALEGSTRWRARGGAPAGGPAAAASPGAANARDTATALVLAGCLASGVLLASDVFGDMAGLEGLLFGSLLAIEGRDLVLAGAAGVATLAATVTLGPRWLATGFDPGTGVGRTRAGELALLGLTAASVVASLAAVGALLVTALFVVPAATARLVTSRLVTWQIASVALVAAQGVGGLLVAYELDAPPGATIAMLAGGVFAATALGRAAVRRTRRPRAEGAGS